jgi:hypothetical protein
VYIRRIPVEIDTTMQNSEFQPKQGSEEITYTLLNLMDSAPSSPMSLLADFLVKIENLSHVLVWTSADVQSPDQQVPIDLIEFPRLNLTFRRKERNDEVRLYCTEHSGLCFSNIRNAKVNKIIEGLSSFALLQGRIFLIKNLLIFQFILFLKMTMVT